MAVATAPPESSLSRYWEMLGLKPGTDVETLDTTYYLLVEKFAKDPTEDDAKLQQGLGHAYAVLRRSCVAKESAVAIQRAAPKSEKRPLVMGGLLTVGIVVLVLMNLGDLRAAFVSYRPGDVLRLKGQSQPYGTVTDYEKTHSFGIGDPAPAYRFQLASGESVWLSARVVEKGMQK